MTEKKGWTTGTQYLVSGIALLALIAAIGFLGVWVMAAAHGGSASLTWGSAVATAVSLAVCVGAFVSAVRAIGHLGLQRPNSESECARYEAQYAAVRAD